MNCVFGFKFVQGMEEEMEVVEVVEEIEVNSLSCRVENKYGFLCVFYFEEFMFSLLFMVFFINCFELDGDIEVLLQMQIVEEVWNYECLIVFNFRISFFIRIFDEVMFCLLLLKLLNIWDVLCMDFSKFLNFE